MCNSGVPFIVSETAFHEETDVSINMAVGTCVVNAVLEALGPIDGLRVLEVDCGSGSNLRAALERGADTWGVDPSITQLRKARTAAPEANLRDGTVEELPFDSCSFDAVYSFGRCATTKRAATFIAELARVCRVGGLVAIPLAEHVTHNSDFVASERDAVAITAGLWPLSSDPSVMISMKIFSQQSL